MTTLVSLARWEIIILFGGFAAVILAKLLTGAISLAGLLTSAHADGTSGFSLGRAQLLAFTIATALYYLIQVIQNPSRTSLPGIPAGLLAALGGSGSIYLVGKAWSLYANRPESD